MPNLPILSCRLSKTGGRAANEDHCGELRIDAAGCWVVADGLGGHRGGAAASRLAVEAALASFRDNRAVTPEAARAHIERAQQAILDEQKRKPELAAMRSTIVVLISDGASAIWAHVGDSRLYHFSDGSIAFQTRDHSVPQMLVDAGEITADEIRLHADRNRLLKSLGNEGKCVVAVAPAPVALKRRDAFLLCTDGFWEYVTELDMRIALAQADSPEQWLAGMEQDLLDNRDRPEEHDNYTAIAVMAS